jgi:small-conductance mechanosensitive channel
MTIGYDAPWRQVHAMILEGVRRTEGVASDPAPFVLQTALSDFYIEYRLSARSETAVASRPEIMSRLYANIVDVFNEHGVQIMSPHYLGDPDHAKVVPQARWYEAPAKRPEK